MEQNISLPSETTEASANVRTRERAINFSRAQVELWLRHRNQRKNFLYRQLFNLFEYILALQCSAIGAIAIYSTKTNNNNSKWVYAYVCGIWCVFYITRVIRLSINLKQIVEYLKKKHVVSTMIKNFILVVVHIEISLFCMWGYCSNVYSIIVPMFIALLSPFFVYIKSSNKCFSFLRAIKFVIATLRFALVFMLLLYYTHKVKLSKTLLYIPLWISLIISILSTLFCITILMIAACSSVREKRFREECN